MNGPPDLMKQSPRHAPAATTEADASPMSELMGKPMQRYNLALEPQSFDAGWKVAELCAKMKLCGCVTPEDAYLRIIAGRAIGLPAMASVQLIIPIYNEKADTFTLTMYVKGKLALALSRPDIIEYIRPSIITAEKAVFVGKRIGQPEQSYEYTFEDAKVAGLVGRGADGGKQNNYDKHPKAMLAWRAAGRLLDLIAGDVLNGIASHEDVVDEVERDAREPRGTVPDAVKAAIPTRDWAKEADVIKVDMTRAVEAKDAAAMKEIRKRFATFKGEAPAEVGEDLQRFYNMLAGEHRKAAPATAPAETPKPAAATQAAATPAAAPATATQSAPRRQYIPPHARGDAYDGPETPDPPFGNS